MKEMNKKNLNADWALMVSLLVWIVIIVSFIKLISSGQTKIPHPVLEVIEASATQENMTIAHRKGDPVRFANTKCLWTPDINSPNITSEAGPIVLAGREKEQGRVSDLEPGEVAKLEKDVLMKEGSVGRILIVDLMSGQQIFSHEVRITK